MDVLGFFTFSTLEGVAIFSIMLYMFRFGINKYIGHIVIVNLLITFQNYVVRDLLLLPAIAPLFNILVTILFLAIVLRFPIIWSIIMTAIGFAAFVTIQTIIVYSSFGFLSIEVIESDPMRGYLLQSVTSLVCFLVGYILYKKRYGFTFELEKLRMKWERGFVIILIIGFIVALGALMYFQEIYINLFVFLASLVGFLIYSLRKEAEDQ